MKDNKDIFLIPHSRSFITGEDIRSVDEVLKNNYVGCGESVKTLEHAFKRRYKRKFAIAVNSGSAALMLSLRALNLQRGSKIATSVYVCSAVINVILESGQAPTFIDTGVNDVNVDAMALNTCLIKMGQEIGAVIVPYIGGYAVPVSELITKGIPVIEDCAASIGARTPDGEIGKWGTLSVFSFGSTKMITGGSGGMILTDTDLYHARIRNLMSYDDPNALRNAYGCNFIMNNMQAALAASQLSRLGNTIEARTRIADRYDKLLFLKSGTFIVKPEGIKPSFYRYVFFAKNKKQLLSALRMNGIDARGSIAHFMGSYFDLPVKARVNAERVERELISLPIYPNLTVREQNKILSVLKDAVN